MAAVSGKARSLRPDAWYGASVIVDCLAIGVLLGLFATQTPADFMNRSWRLAAADVRIRMAAKALLICPILIWLATQYENHYINLLLSLYKWMLELALPDYDVVAISQSLVNDESVVSATVHAVRPQFIGAQQLPPGFSVTASTLTAHAVKHIVVILAILFIWPRLTWFQRGIRLLICLPFLFAIELIDIPLVLAGAVRDLVEASIAPEAATRSWRISWIKVMDGGGRVLISIIAGVFASIVHESFLNKPRWRKATQ